MNLAPVSDTSDCDITGLSLHSISLHCLLKMKLVESSRLFQQLMLSPVSIRHLVFLGVHVRKAGSLYRGLHGVANVQGPASIVTSIDAPVTPLGENGVGWHCTVIRVEMDIRLDLLYPSTWRSVPKPCVSRSLRVDWRFIVLVGLLVEAFPLAVGQSSIQPADVNKVKVLSLEHPCLEQIIDGEDAVGWHPGLWYRVEVHAMDNS